VRVVAAFQNVSAEKLKDADAVVSCDVLVCGDDAAAKETTIALVGDLGMRGLDAGPLANAVALEAMTPVLLYMNKTYKKTGLALAIEGFD
jgi:hypothetical protein